MYVLSKTVSVNQSIARHSIKKVILQKKYPGVLKKWSRNQLVFKGGLDMSLAGRILVTVVTLLMLQIKLCLLSINKVLIRITYMLIFVEDFCILGHEEYPCRGYNQLIIKQLF